MTPSAAVDTIFATYRARGHGHYGENVTENEHALQCATFAERSGEPDHIVAACLLHDFGHLEHDLGEDFSDRGIDDGHEELGGKALARYFVESVVEPTRLHVAAKRYLCRREPGYYDGLSETSKKSLELQGGPMTEAEAVVFEANKHYRDAVTLRRYDDKGKVPGMETPDFEAFREKLERFVKPGAGP